MEKKFISINHALQCKQYWPVSNSKEAKIICGEIKG